MTSLDFDRRLLVVSNRLPIVVDRGPDDEWDIRSGSGGLVTAMTPVLNQLGGLWIGWPGIAADEAIDLDPLLREIDDDKAYSLRAIPLTEEERNNYYYGFSNEVLWPLFHDLQSRTNFEPRYWGAYRHVNRKFATAVAEASNPDDFIWVHDYHLMTVGEALREYDVEATTGYFLHTPFPSPDIFAKLPWGDELLVALLHYDLLGFQTDRDRRNFIRCLPQATADVEIVEQEKHLRVEFDGRSATVGTFPISIDYEEFAAGATSNTVAKHVGSLRQHLPDTQILLGIDRLDYTKGLPYKLKAFREALEQHPELRGNVVLIQVVVPSRERVPEYHQLKTEVDQLVGEINGEFTRSGWVPIHYIYRSLDKDVLLAHYRTAEMLLATPLKDGMNLVAKEYCAASVEESGVLILSEFAGAAAQLQDHAILVNPYDIEETAEAIARAYRMNAHERHRHMRLLRSGIEKHDIFWWVNSFLHSAPVTV